MVIPIYRGGLPTNYAIGRGRLLIGNDASFFSGGSEYTVSDAYRDVGNCTAFSLSQESETKEHTSYLSGAATRDLEVPISTKVSVSFQLDEASMANLARFLSGEVWNTANTADLLAAVANAAAIVSTLVSGAENYYVDTNTTDFIYDLWYQISLNLGSGPITAVDFEAQASQAITVHKNPTNRTTGGTLMTEGTDYEIDRKSGMIRFFRNSPTGLSRGDSFRVGWAAPTVAKNPDSGVVGVDDSLTAIKILTNSGKTVPIRFIGENPNNANLVDILDLWAVKLRPDGELQLIGDDWLTMGFTGALQAITNPPPYSSEYGRLMRRSSYST